MTAPRRAVSPAVPRPLPRGAVYEGGWCVTHDLPTETAGGVERCRRCVTDFDEALAVLDGGRDRRRA